MNRRLSVLIAAAGFVLASACQTSQTGTSTNLNISSPTPDQFAPARATFEKNCKSCHGEQGNGGPVKLEDGTRLKVPSLREGHALHHPDSDFVKQITKGGDGMPAFKDKLTPAEIDDLVRFVRHEFQAGVTPPAQPMKSPMKGMKM